jgi:hypothetical protein
MIVKTSRGSDFAGLHRYLTEDRDHEIVLMRELTSAAAAAQEMAMVARAKPTVSKPVFHFAVSFAPEDTDRVTDALALELLAEVDEELGLSGHQCLAARHNDTAHRHYHFSYNVVHPVTFERPPDRPNQALLDSTFERRPHRKGPPRPLSWDAFMLQRLWAVCDRFAKRHRLRRVGNPLRSENKEEHDQSTRMPAGALRREERTGIKPLLEQKEGIWAALGAGTWEDRQIALQKIGIRIEAAEVPAKAGGSRIRGVRLVSLMDPKNAIKASTLGAAYGLGALDQTIREGSPPFATWWAKQKTSLVTKPEQTTPSPGDTHQAYLNEFRRYEQQQLAARAAATEGRSRLKDKHRKERKKLTREIASERERALAGVPRCFRRVARSFFRARVAAPQRAELGLRQRAELAELRVPRKMGWAIWLRERSRVGDRVARALLAEMEARHRRQGHRSKIVEGGSKAEPQPIRGADNPAKRAIEDPASHPGQAERDRGAPHPTRTVPLPLSGPEEPESDLNLQYAWKNGSRGRGGAGR